MMQSQIAFNYLSTGSTNSDGVCLHLHSWFAIDEWTEGEEEQAQHVFHVSQEFREEGKTLTFLTQRIFNRYA